jgi:hypothetical protein
MEVYACVFCPVGEEWLVIMPSGKDMMMQVVKEREDCILVVV